MTTFNPVTTVSAVSRVEEALRKAHAAQPALNAFTEIDDLGALERAAELDRRAADGADTGPLAGVPIALKDLIDHEGHVTTSGSAFYSHLATKSAPCVESLEAAGAVIIGRAGLHEFAFGFSSENPHHGPVRNPWDIETSTGGSSGGSAAAVAAGIVPIAIGTDTGGSVRVPAALCGTYGLKVTHGSVPLEGVFPLVASIDTVGPLADSVVGLETSYRVMSGDTSGTPEPRPVRLGIPEPWVESAPFEAEIAVSFERVVESLRDMGHEVGVVHLPDAVPSTQIWHAIAEEVREVHAGFRARGQPYGADVARRLDDAQLVTPTEIAEAKAWQAMIRERFGDAFGTVDILMTPTVPVRKKRIGEDEIGGRHYRSVVSYFTALVNHSLHPAIALPLAGTGSPPASLQLIGRRGGEVDLLGFANDLDGQGLVGFEAPPTEFT